MIKEIPSIFNDVIGPIMRGPSSSHTAASVRMAKLAKQMVKGEVIKFIIDFNKEGSLATTYHGHGSDIGLAGGILGLEPNDPRLVNSIEEAKNAGIEVQFNIIDYKADHPNTYKMTVVSNSNETIHVTGISVGGGMIEITEIENMEVSIKGDFFETVILLDKVEGDCLNKYIEEIKKIVKEFDECIGLTNDIASVVVIKTQKKLSEEIITLINQIYNASNIIALAPVLPTMSYKNCEVPYLTAEKMLEIAKKDNLELWEAAVLYESVRGNMSKEEVFAKMKHISEILINSIEEGLQGTDYEDRILGAQAWKIQKGQDQGKLIQGNVLNRVIASITALMEIKSSMGVFVAAPTAGACGGLSGTIVGTAFELGMNIDDITKGMLAAGMIGIFIAEHATFAGEVGGCQAECGSGSGMAAGGLVQLMGGTIEQAVDAASVGLQNILGLACDPVGARVEVPCLGRNILAGSNAIASANMILAGYDKVVPLDETIHAMNQVGKMIPAELRCTELAGLSICETSLKLRKKMNSKIN